MAATWIKTAGPAEQATGGPVATFSAQALGAAAADRVTVVSVGAAGSYTSQAWDLTVGGLTATRATFAVEGIGKFCAVYYVDTSSLGTTADIVFSATGSTPNTALVAITVGRLTGVVLTPNTTAKKDYSYGADPQVTTSPLTIATGGFGIVRFMSETVGTPTWNVGVQDYYISGSYAHTSGYISTSGSQTPSISGYNGLGAMLVAASWAPAAATGNLKLFAEVLDTGLADLANANKLYICSSAPTDYATATTGGAVALGNANITPGAPAAAAGGGRQVTVPAITAGAVTNSGTPTHWALVRTGTSALLATGELTGVPVTASQAFTLDAMTIIQPGVAV